MQPPHLESGPMDGEVLKAARRSRFGWLRLFAWFFVGGVCAAMVRNVVVGRSATAERVPDRIDFSIPSVDLSLEDVVRAQIDSMRSAVRNPDTLVTCYSLASPNNRQQTGPFDRFQHLVASEPYRQIGLCRDYQVGHAIVSGRAGRVLASFLSENGQGFAFQFILVKQTDEPYRDCWMTDMVVGMHPQAIGELIGESQQLNSFKGVDL